MGGFAAQAIIVTCKDENEDEDKPLLKEDKELILPKKLSEAIKPPLSFLAPIMKMIAAKAKARVEDLKIQQRKPKIVVHPLSGSIPRPLEHHMQSLPPAPVPFMEPRPILPFEPNNMNIFNLPPLSGPVNLPPMPKIIESGTIHNPLPNLLQRQFNGPVIDGQIISRAFNGPLPEVIDGQVMDEILKNLPIQGNNQIIRIEERRIPPPPPSMNLNRIIPFGPFQGPFPHLPMKPIINNINHHPHHHMEEPNQINNNIKFPRKFHLDVKPRIFNEQNHPRNNRVLGPSEKPKPIIGQSPAGPFPFPLPKNVIPLEPIPANSQEKKSRASKMIKLLPFNIRPLRLLSPRKSRLLTPDAPYPTEQSTEPKFIENKPQITFKPILPLARGNPLKQVENNDETEEKNIPGPTSRALIDPVPLPKIRFLPGRLLRLPLAPCELNNFMFV